MQDTDQELLLSTHTPRTKADFLLTASIKPCQEWNGPNEKASKCSSSKVRERHYIYARKVLDYDREHTT
jgi:hypothetical protein